MKVGVRLIYYDQTTKQILHCAGGRFFPGCFPDFPSTITPSFGGGGRWGGLVIRVQWFPRSLCFMWLWFGLEILRLVYKKVFFKILNGFCLIWPFNFQKNSTIHYTSWKIIFSKLGTKGIKRSRIVRWFQKCAELLCQEVPKDFFSEKWFQFLVKKFFPFAKLETSAYFWNQRIIPLLLIPCTPNFKEIFFNSYKGRHYFFGV